MRRLLSMLAFAMVTVSLAITAPVTSSAAVVGTGTSTIVVTATPAFEPSTSFGIFTLTGPTSSTTFGSIGTPTSFSDLEPGTYKISFMDFGAFIDAPQSGSATVTVGPGETVDVEIQLSVVGFIRPIFGIKF